MAVIESRGFHRRDFVMDNMKNCFIIGAFILIVIIILVTAFTF